MIITPERLTDLATEEIETRAARHPIVAAYLVGSVLRGEPLLGGCADVDVIVIHPTTPLRPREIKRLSRQVHLDLFHKSKSEYENPRDLRTDPLLGTSLCGSLRLHDPDHFFDWVQAAACAQFTRADNRLARAQELLAQARNLRADLVNKGSRWVHHFYRAAWHGANALCCLADKPVHGRQALLRLREIMEQLEIVPHYHRFLDLFEARQMDQWNVPTWLTSFGKAYDLAIQLEQGELFKPVRRDYYLKALQELAEAGQPEAAVISMIGHWPRPATAEDPLVQEIAEAEAWRELLAATGFTDSNYTTKQADLENFLDKVELYMEAWAAEHGA